MNCLLPFPLGKTKIKQPVKPIDIASSAVQQLWPHAQMQTPTVHGNIPQSLHFSTLNTEARSRLSQNSQKIYATTFVVRQKCQFSSNERILVLFRETH